MRTLDLTCGLGTLGYNPSLPPALVVSGTSRALGLQWQFFLCEFQKAWLNQSFPSASWLGWAKPLGPFNCVRQECWPTSAWNSSWIVYVRSDIERFWTNESAQKLFHSCISEFKRARRRKMSNDFISLVSNIQQFDVTIGHNMWR